MDSVRVLCPLRFEQAAVGRALRRAGLGRVRVACTGPGAGVARAVEALDSGAGFVVLAGVAGGLSPAFGTSAWVPERIVGADGRSWTPTAAAGVDRGVVLAGVDAPVSTPDERAALHGRTGAALVDMESHRFGEACTRRGLRWCVVRGVSDRHDEVLPRETLAWVDAAGATRLSRVALDLARRPGLVLAAARLGRRSSAALAAVGARLAELLRAERARGGNARGGDAAGDALADNRSFLCAGSEPEDPRSEAARGPGHPAPPVDAPGGGTTISDNAYDGADGAARGAAAGPVTPLPVPEGARAVILFGGTFDPPHRAHAALPVLARRAWCAARGMPERDAWLVYVPARRSPLKAHGPGASPADRVAMLRLALADVPSSAVWTDEIDRGAGASASPSYTVDTVRRARAVAGPGVELRLLVGADQAVVFHRWREARELLRLAEPLVMARGGVATPAELRRAVAESGAWSEAEVRAWGARFLELARDEVSATGVRHALAAGDGAGVAGGAEVRGGGALDPRVAAYIREHGLYRGETG